MKKIALLLLGFCGTLFTGQPTCFYFVRHGQTEWNSERRIQGQKDIPLSEAGYSEVRQLKRKLDAVDFDLCISSDLQRASTTATVLLRGRLLAIETDSRLRGYNYGLLEGRLASELEKQDYIRYAESDAQIQQRIFVVLDEILERHSGKMILIITHGGVIRNILARLFSVNPFSHVQVSNLGLLYVEIDEEQWRIKEIQGIEISSSLF